MANDTNLRAFPSDRYDALAMLFLRNQDLSGKTPEEIAIMYDDAYEKISGKLNELNKERTAKKREQKRNLAF